MFIPPPVRGMGAAAGFSMRLQDTLGHAGQRVRAHHAGVRRRGQPHARHRQRVHHLPGGDAAGVRRRRPRQGADAEGAGHQHLRGHARVHGLGLRQRLQHVRPHLSRHRAGRRRLPARSGERVEDPRAQHRRADGAARQPGDVPGDRRARARAALQPVPVGRGARHGAAGHQLGPGAADHARRWRARSCRRASPSSGPICPTRRPRSGAPATTSSCSA